MSVAAKIPRQAADPMAARAVSRALEEVGLRPEGASPLVLERGWPLPKVPLMLRYRDPDVTGKRGRWWSVHFLGVAGPPFVYRSAIKRRQATYLENLGAVVHRFPDDPLLTNVNDAISSRMALARVTSGLAKDGRGWERVTAQVLSYKPSRRLTIRYRLSAPGVRGKTVFGKCLPAGSDEAAVRAHKALESAARRDRFERLRFPTLAGEVAEWNMALWKRVPGRSVFELLDSPELEDAAQLAGSCLAELHGSTTGWARVHDRQRELETLGEWISAITFATPELEPVLRGTLSRLTQTALGLPVGSLAPSHRDFYDKQLVMHDGTGAVLDLETASYAEPELDVANFLAHLELRRLQGRKLDRSAPDEAFVEGYSNQLRALDPQRIDWYLASSLLRLACVYSFRPDAVELSRNLCDAAQRAAATV